MQLTYLRVKNFRSLHDIELNNLKQFNVLIGKNNAGKSAVFGALRFLANVVNAKDVYKWGENIASHFAKNSPVEIFLEFKLREDERNAVVQPLASIFTTPSQLEAFGSSPLCHKIRYHFKTVPQQPTVIFPSSIEILGENSKWVPLLREGKKVDKDSFQFRFSVLFDAYQSHETKKADEARLNEALKKADADADPEIGFQLRRMLGNKREPVPEELSDEARLNSTETLPISWGREEFNNWRLWPFVLLGHFLKNSFFFDHFRTFYPEQQVGGKGDLSQDGNNLVQVLNFWGNNHRPKFERIQNFTQEAFAGIGGLETPIKKESQQTQTAFRSSVTGEQIPLQHMGGGVAQLLMAAVALETTTAEYPIFLEEPETNLHPGAQRFLADRLCDEGRQVFITTHSPTFVNLPRSKSVHKVKMIGGKTNIVSLDDKTLHAALAEIGARNSDVLLSDAAVFVEGESDLQVLQEWCRTHEISLAGTNTSILVMRSFGRPETAVPLRSDTLKSVASSAGIPHLFLLDCDELSEVTKRKIKKELENKVHIFERREIENYLLIPRCIRQAIREKLIDGRLSTKALDDTKDRDLERLMRVKADSLKNLVFIKQVRGLLEAPPDGFYPRRLFESFETIAGRKELSRKIENALKQRFEEHIKKQKLEKVSSAAKRKFDKEWKKEDSWIQMAPGAELLEAVFSEFGTNYNKTTDARRIAKQMKKEEFPAETLELLEKVRALIKRDDDSI